MSAARVYLFQGNSLIVPQSLSGEETVQGLDRGLAERAFNRVDYYAVPPIEGTTAPAGTGGGDGPIPAALLDKDTTLPPDWRAFPVREALTALSIAGRPAERLLRAYHVSQWREDSRFCGTCGAVNGDAPGELARLCPCCGRMEYPRISPAVITLVTRDDGRILLAHNNKFKNKVYSLIAGFVEAGESLEAAAVREIKEEVNIDAEDLRFVKSQSWPFPNSLMVGFTARYAGGELKCDGEEITDAGWYSGESVRGGTPELPAQGSVARLIIERWLAEAGK
ncbi:MAG: NAD(+) diphosphatase [Treponema sp.]|jgi:NAD+ diphosphatase|nr:NAD(+) diphosphatase [Treponema sp.]